MDKKSFFERFINILENTKEKHQLDTLHDALILWFGENYLFLDPDEVKDRIIRDAHAEGVDSILIDYNNFNLLFIQAKVVNDFEKTDHTFPENDIKSTLGGIRFLLKGDYKGKITPELENLTDEYHDLDKSGDYETKVLFLTLRKKVSSKFIDHFLSDFSQIQVEFLDFDWLYNFFINDYLTRTLPPPKKLSFEVQTDILRKDIPYKSRVFTIKGKELAKAYSEHKEVIFQKNVRYFLGLPSRSINMQIFDTAKDIERSKYFWYFNNGITMICKKINESASGKVIILLDPQIINGAQTTYALHEAYKNGELRDDVEVILKVIETEDTVFLENVTVYTNSQNSIRLRDLCSNDRIQLKIQKILFDSYKYFYERKRGEFDSQYPTIEAKRKFLGDEFRDKVIDNEKAAQAIIAMFIDKPAEAKNEKWKIFLRDKSGFYNDIFDYNDDSLPEKILLSWKLLKFIEEEKRKYKKKYQAAVSLPEKEKNIIYKYDFLLHSEFFILNIFRDFLENKNYNMHEKNDLIQIISSIDNKDELIKEIYNLIVEELAIFIEQQKLKPGYYHNKFFKNEKSIALIRNEINKKFDFVRVL